MAKETQCDRWTVREAERQGANKRRKETDGKIEKEAKRDTRRQRKGER
jgi:hypothetical protein